MLLLLFVCDVIYVVCVCWYLFVVLFVSGVSVDLVIVICCVCFLVCDVVCDVYGFCLLFGVLYVCYVCCL